MGRSLILSLTEIPTAYSPVGEDTVSCPRNKHCWIRIHKIVTEKDFVRGNFTRAVFLKATLGATGLGHGSAVGSSLSCSTPIVYCPESAGAPPLCSLCLLIPGEK